MFEDDVFSTTGDFSSPVHKPNDTYVDWSSEPMSMPGYEPVTNRHLSIDFGMDTINFEDAFKLFETKEPARNEPVVPKIPPTSQRPIKRRPPLRLRNVFKPFVSLEATEMTVQQLRAMSNHGF